MEEMKKLAEDKQNPPELQKRKNDVVNEVELAQKRQKSEREEQQEKPKLAHTCVRVFSN